MLSFPLTCYSNNMKDVLNDIAGSMHVDVFMEQDIGNDEVNLPGKVSRSDASVYLGQVLKGYNHAELFDGDRLVKIWVYRKGTGAFVKLTHGGANTGNTSQVMPLPESGIVKPKPRSNVLSRASPPLFYSKGIKRSLGGVYYKKNAFGYKKPIILPLSLRNSSRKNSAYRHYLKSRERAQIQKSVAREIMIDKHRQGYLDQGISKNTK